MKEVWEGQGPAEHRCDLARGHPPLVHLANPRCPPGRCTGRHTTYFLKLTCYWINHLRSTYLETKHSMTSSFKPQTQILEWHIPPSHYLSTRIEEKSVAGDAWHNLIAVFQKVKAKYSVTKIWISRRPTDEHEQRAFLCNWNSQFSGIKKSW